MSEEIKIFSCPFCLMQIKMDRYSIGNCKNHGEIDIFVFYDFADKSMTTIHYAVKPDTYVNQNFLFKTIIVINNGKIIKKLPWQSELFNPNTIKSKIEIILLLL
jgi:hypothetical protein